MSIFFQNKYRIPSARLQSWNYANAGMYFITICTRNRELYFGEIVNTPVETQCIASLPPAMNPTKIGKIAETEWFKTPQLRPDMNLELGEFVVMPNHIHGIICIGENEYNGDERRGRRDAMHGVSIYGGGDNDDYNGFKILFTASIPNRSFNCVRYKLRGIT